MSKKIYVGNLPFSASEDEVYDLFTPFGNVDSLAMINDRDTGRFRGFCFVEMADAEAEAAIEALDGHDFNGRALRVNEARPRENRGGGGRRGGGGYRGGGNRDNYGGGRGWG
ncbi:RNA recognition motif domain-containing protein [Candidatus Leptofilum sp.]|uniref:RNA recognition motif domain-containing protein n=1 Tax=Candidatus Leptofilum sp. TaxID=3241576 RepID=UPI003B59A7F1